MALASPYLYRHPPATLTASLYDRLQSSNSVNFSPY